MNETKKMMEIIHQNRNRVYKENLRKEKKENKKSIALIVMALVGIVLILTLSYKYNEKQVANCIEGGHDETFCRYGGE